MSPREQFFRNLDKVASELGITLDPGHDFSDDTQEFRAVASWKSPTAGGIASFTVIRAVTLRYADSQEDIRQKLVYIFHQPLYEAYLAISKMYSGFSSLEEWAKSLMDVIFPDGTDPGELEQLGMMVEAIIRRRNIAPHS